MADKRKILVTGATGGQGGSVVRHLLRRGTFDVRAITRNPESDKARELTQTGVEVVAGTMDDVKSLQKAMQGCWGVFGVTNYWEHWDREYDHGINLMQAVEAAKPEFYLFSSLADPRKLGEGYLKVPHFELKARVEEEIRKRPIWAGFVHVAFYFENLVNYGMIQRQDDGTLGFGMPQGDTLLGGVSVQDVGGPVAAMFEHSEEYVGQVVTIAGDARPASEYAAILSRVLGEKVTYQHIPREVYAGFGFPGAAEMADMYHMYRLYMTDYSGAIEESKRLYPGMQTFEQWATANKSFFARVTQVKA